MNPLNVSEEIQLQGSPLEPLVLTEASDDCKNNFNDSHSNLNSSNHNLNHESSKSFLHFLYTSKGPPQLIFLSLLWALAFGVTVGVIPDVLTDRYATLYHGLDPKDHCSNYHTATTITSIHPNEIPIQTAAKPQSCLDGSSDAQTAAAISAFISNGITFLTSSLVGTLSDQHGRRVFLILGQLLSCLPSIALVSLQMIPNMAPKWFYIASASSGAISWIAIALSSLSDVIPNHLRSSVFGLLLSSFSIGFAVSPMMALHLTHFSVSLLSMSLLILGLVYSVLCLPETLPQQDRIVIHIIDSRYQSTALIDEDEPSVTRDSHILIRPFLELSILNRNHFFRLLSVLAFFSAMSYSADQTLLIYYVEDRLAFNDHDIAMLFLLLGTLGIIVQSVILKKATDALGQRVVIVISFLAGAVKNAIYALAYRKQHIFLAAVVGTLSSMSFPTISAMKANNVASTEQGRIQGALYALTSLANGLGPLMLKFAARYTERTTHPGSYFLVATLFMLIATGCGFALPKDKGRITEEESDEHGLESCLLQENMS